MRSRTAAGCETTGCCPRVRFEGTLDNAVSRVDLTDERFAPVAGFSMVYDAAGTPRVIDENGVITREGSRVLHAAWTTER